MTQREAQHIWDKLCQGLENRLQERTFRDWVSPCTPTTYDGSTLWVQAPSASAKLWIEQQLAEDFHDSLVQIGMPELRLTFTTDNEKPLEKVFGKVPAGTTKSLLTTEVSVFPQGFESYTLDNFVVGPNCELAFSAAVGMVKNYGRQNLSFNMNPLFIYGGSGLGKTHLMVGIGKGLMPLHSELQIVYFKAESFYHEMTGAIKANNTEALRQKYQSKDILLFDDIQNLKATMVRSQEEIFYIFEHMLQHGKQIVITSDRPPGQLEGLHDRLVTRCKSGLTVDVYPPDFETRVAILKKKLEEPYFEGYPVISNEVIDFIAGKAKASVRDLQGLLKRTIFQAGFLGVDVSISVAQEAYRGMTGEEPTSSVSIEKICRSVAEHFDILFNDLLKKKSRRQELLIPRQIAMYLIREMTTASYADIGRVFNNMHHSTVMNSIDVVKKRMQKDSVFNKIVHGLLNSVG
jgi:chromosomal replication initiator protein